MFQVIRSQSGFCDEPRVLSAELKRRSSTCGLKYSLC
jgi:hypothetical protein